MNLLNLILIVLIITIEPFINFIFKNGLIFIKPENLTKTELVEKFKEFSSSKLLKDLKTLKQNPNKKDEDKKDTDKITIKDFLKSYYFKFLGFIFKFKILITFNYYLKIIKYRIISLINKYQIFKLK